MSAARPPAPAPHTRSRLVSISSRVRHSHKLQSLFRTIVGVETDQRLIALTFDDGPDPQWTPAVMETLARLGAKGTFFVLGRNVESHPGLVRQLLADGHAIGNHTFSHSCLAHHGPGHVVRELGACHRAIKQATGQSVWLMRPPFGAQTIDTFLTAHLLGYRTIHWSASAHDWLGEPARVLADRVLAAAGPGAIVLMHDGWQPPPDGSVPGNAATLADRTATIEALPLIIEPLSRDGYRFVTVPELLAAGSPRRKRWFWADPVQTAQG